MPHGTDWTRDEHIVAFNLYCRTPFGRMHKGNPEIIELAGLLGRTPSSVAMKLSNFARLDLAEQARGIKGLRSGSGLEAEIWDEFHSNWEQLAYESEVVKQGLAQPAVQVAVPLPAVPSGPTEAIRETRVRLVQGFFRETVLRGDAKVGWPSQAVCPQDGIELILRLLTLRGFARIRGRGESTTFGRSLTGQTAWEGRPTGDPLISVCDLRDLGTQAADREPHHSVAGRRKTPRGSSEWADAVCSARPSVRSRPDRRR